MHRALPAFALCLVLSGLAACRTVKPDSAGLVVESHPQYRLLVNSPLFGGHFRVDQCAAAKGDNGLLRATVVLENLKGDRQLEYRYRWVDGGGVEITSYTDAWRAMSAGSREKVMLSGAAPSKNAADFILDVRFIHPSTRW